jgi:cyclophilin family peptidyl-prolyl cis-trans isomerase
MRPLLALAALIAAPALAQDAEPPTPASIVAAAPAADWRAIDPADLLVMTLAPDRDGNERQVTIQLMPPPFSEGWVENIRTLAKAHWWDGTSVYRVVDNWVAQWGDGEDEGRVAKALPAGVVSPQADYWIDGDTLGDHTGTDLFAEPSAEQLAQFESLAVIIGDRERSEEEHEAALTELLALMGLSGLADDSPSHRIAMISIDSTQTRLTKQGWHERDSTAEWVEFWNAWPIANRQTISWEDDDGNVLSSLAEVPETDRERWYEVVDTSFFWPIHCYGSVGVARDLAPDTGTGAELYAVIGHAPRQLDRNIAVVGRVIEGIEHLSTLPRGRGEAGVYDDPALRVPIVSVRLGDALPAPPRFEYLDTRSESFAHYLTVRANRSDAFYNVPAGGVDVCNVQVPIRRVAAG